MATLNLTISGSTNVVATTVTTAQTLSINTAGSVTPTTLAGLTDTSVAGITNGQGITWNSTSEQYEATTLSTTDTTYTIATQQASSNVSIKLSSNNDPTQGITVMAGTNITLTESGGNSFTIDAVAAGVTAGDGIDVSGSQVSTDLKANGGLVIESTELAVDLGASSITGTLDVPDGGTGATSLTANGVVIGNGGNALTAIDMSTKGHILVGDGVGNPSALSIGTNGKVLTADSAEVTGVKWDDSPVEFADSTFRITDDGDSSKEIKFQASGITTGTDRTITMPDANVDLSHVNDLPISNLADGTDGELITWDASGTPATVAVGTSGHVLTSNGTGSAPTFQAAAAGGDEYISFPGSANNGNAGANRFIPLGGSSTDTSSINVYTEVIMPFAGTVESVTAMTANAAGSTTTALYVNGSSVDTSSDTFSAATPITMDFSSNSVSTGDTVAVGMNTTNAAGDTHLVVLIKKT